MLRSLTAGFAASAGMLGRDLGKYCYLCKIRIIGIVMKELSNIITRFSLIFTATFLIGCSGEVNFTQYVDPKIGSGGHGHVFVGANVPFGMVQLGPTSIPQEWDWCSGYHDSDSTVIGFSHTHLSGTGIGDLFDITVMPVHGDSLTFARGRESDPESGLWSYADRTKESARPGYYSVYLTRYNVAAELTATNRVGMHRYSFDKDAGNGIVIDLKNGGCWDRTMDAFMEASDPMTGKALASDDQAEEDSPVLENVRAIRGYRYSRGWADDQKIYFYAEFSEPCNRLTIRNMNIQIWDDEYIDVPLYAHAEFEGKQVLMKVALSPVSMEGAYANMKAELPGWDFDAVADAAGQAWNDELSRIRIETGDEEAKKIFYTALYHTMIAPSTFCDIDGNYRGADGRTYENPGYETYTTFSLWDTYRAAMPLFTIFQPERYIGFINTMLAIYKEQGKLPVWHLHGCETNCMVGNPGIPPVADAMVKEFEGFDYGLAYEAMKASAIRPDRGQEHRMEYGYIPCETMNESVAYDLEYALADGALANAASLMAGRASCDSVKASYEADLEYFTARSRSYRHLFDPETGFIRGKYSNGEFREDYSPFSSNHRGDDYCEGNGWQYTWLVPHDLDGLIGCFGSKEAFIEKLDSLFIVSSVLEGEDISPDISGLIGQYAHGNEPSHHILYFYTMAGQPWKTADKVREVLETLYSAEPDGLSGNEDVGQMSAWYVLSSLGFYEVEPASGRYWFGSPLFDEAEIKVGRDSAGGDITFRITAENNSDTNRYIQSITLNGKPYDKWYIDHSDIAAGGELVFVMGNESSTTL